MARGTFLSQVPPVTLRLMIATAVVTLGCVVAAHAGVPQLLEAFVYQPGAVVPGLRFWKLLSAVFVTGTDPMGFLFGLIALYFLGGWFERSFGSRRFLRFFVLSAIGASLLPLSISVFSPSVRAYPYFGNWPVFEALTVALGLLQPRAQVYFYMIIPVTARQLMLLSWGLIALFIVFDGGVTPYLCAIGGIGSGFVLTLGKDMARGPRRWWLRLQAARLERHLKKRAAHLRVVPPLASEADDKKTYLH